MQEQWTLTNERVTDFQYSPFKIFNMLITDKMFERLENIVGKKNVKEIIETIVSKSCPVLEKVKIGLSGWKMFQHLISEEENFKDNKRKEPKKFKNGKEYKHYHHFVSLCISRNEYFTILELHHRINTFSMALIIRMMVEVFLALFEKYKDKNVALSKLEEMIVKLGKDDVNCVVEFVVYKEILGNSWRGVSFFQVEYRDAQRNLLFLFKLRL